MTTFVLMVLDAVVLGALVAYLALRRKQPDPVEAAKKRADEAWEVYSAKKQLSEDLLQDALRARLAWKQAVEEMNDAKREWSRCQSELDGDSAGQRIEDLEREAELFIDERVREEDTGTSAYRSRGKVA